MIKKPIKGKSETIIDKSKYILHLFDIVYYWSFIFYFRLNHTIPIYSPLFGYLEPKKYKQNIRNMGVVIFILLVVIVFF
jgi:hypothetical protein